MREKSKIEKDLAAPFDERELKFKPQMVKNNRCLAMAYVNARAVMDRLDDVLGVDGWEDRYTFLPSGSVYCELTIQVNGVEVTRSDVGSPSEQPDESDRIKAAVSDALKRAAVKFGVGRYIYRLPAQWVDYDPVKKQIIAPPSLPDWARPGKQVQKTTPVATAANAQAAVESERKTVSDADKRKQQFAADDKTIYELNVMLGGNLSVGEVNQYLTKLSAMTDYCKTECWTKLTEHARARGWKFNDGTKKFEEKARQNANTSH